MVIYKDEYELAKKIEDVHGYKSATLNAAIAILEEVAQHVDKDNMLPSFSKGYLLEKMEIIKNAIKEE